MKLWQHLISDPFPSWPKAIRKGHSANVCSGNCGSVSSMTFSRNKTHRHESNAETHPKNLVFYWDSTKTFHQPYGGYASTCRFLFLKGQELLKELAANEITDWSGWCLPCRRFHSKTLAVQKTGKGDCLRSDPEFCIAGKLRHSASLKEFNQEFLPWNGL